MNRRVRSVIVSAYLLCCILFGGSSQGVWTNLALQVAAIGLIAWAAIGAEPADEGRKPLFIYLLIALGGLVLLLQLIPLPPALWKGLPGRSPIEAALALVGYSDVAMPLSEAPYQSVLALFAILPGLAMFVALKLLRPSPRWIAVAIVAGMTVSIALGAVQVAGAGESWARFYRFTSIGATGIFANVNHMATLLLVSIPFGVSLLVSAKGSGQGFRQGKWVLGIGGLVLVIVGIALNGSRAALALSIPVLIASAALVPAAMRWRAVALPVAAVALAGGIVLLATAPLAAGSDQAAGSRQQIWATTTQAIGDSFPAGTGLGSFQQVYRQYENHSEISPRYVNHAHNDYLELVLELGAPGLLLILLFLGWWVLSTARIWTSPLGTPFERAATIASAAILAHSAVDFPLRTAAIMAVFGVAIALMTQPLRAVETAAAGERRTRHVKLG